MNAAMLVAVVEYACAFQFAFLVTGRKAIIIDSLGDEAVVKFKKNGTVIFRYGTLKHQITSLEMLKSHLSEMVW